MTFFAFINLSAQNNKSNIIVTISGVSGGEISKDSILKHPYLTCKDTNYIVTYFQITWGNHGGDFIYSNTGNVLVKENIEVFKKLNKGSNLHLENIKVKNELTGIISDTNPINLKLK